MPMRTLPTIEKLNDFFDQVEIKGGTDSVPELQVGGTKPDAGENAKKWLHFAENETTATFETIDRSKGFIEGMTNKLNPLKSLNSMTNPRVSNLNQKLDDAQKQLVGGEANVETRILHALQHLRTDYTVTLKDKQHAEAELINKLIQLIQDSAQHIQNNRVLEMTHWLLRLVMGLINDHAELESLKQSEQFIQFKNELLKKETINLNAFYDLKKGALKESLLKQLIIDNPLVTAQFTVTAAYTPEQLSNSPCPAIKIEKTKDGYTCTKGQNQWTVSRCGDTAAQFTFVSPEQGQPIPLSQQIQTLIEHMVILRLESRLSTLNSKEPSTLSAAERKEQQELKAWINAPQNHQTQIKSYFTLHHYHIIAPNLSQIRPASAEDEMQACTQAYFACFTINGRQVGTISDTQELKPPKSEPKSEPESTSTSKKKPKTPSSPPKKTSTQKKSRCKEITGAVAVTGALGVTGALIANSIPSSDGGLDRNSSSHFNIQDSLINQSPYSPLNETSPFSNVPNSVHPLIVWGGGSNSTPPYFHPPLLHLNASYTGNTLPPVHSNTVARTAPTPLSSPPNFVDPLFIWGGGRNSTLQDVYPPLLPHSAAFAQPIDNSPLNFFFNGRPPATSFLNPSLGRFPQNDIRGGADALDTPNGNSLAIWNDQTRPGQYTWMQPGHSRSISMTIFLDNGGRFTIHFDPAMLGLFNPHAASQMINYVRAQFARLTTEQHVPMIGDNPVLSTTLRNHLSRIEPVDPPPHELANNGLQVSMSKSRKLTLFRPLTAVAIRPDLARQNRGRDEDVAWDYCRRVNWFLNSVDVEPNSMLTQRQSDVVRYCDERGLNGPEEYLSFPAWTSTRSPLIRGNELYGLAHDLEPYSTETAGSNVYGQILLATLLLRSVPKNAIRASWGFSCYLFNGGVNLVSGAYNSIYNGASNFWSGNNNS